MTLRQALRPPQAARVIRLVLQSLLHTARAAPDASGDPQPLSMLRDAGLAALGDLAKFWPALVVREALEPLLRLGGAGYLFPEGLLDGTGGQVSNPRAAPGQGGAAREEPDRMRDDFAFGGDGGVDGSGGPGDGFRRALDRWLLVPNGGECFRLAVAAVGSPAQPVHPWGGSACRRVRLSVVAVAVFVLLLLLAILFDG